MMMMTMTAYNVNFYPASRYSSAVLAVAILSVCLSVARVFVTKPNCGYFVADDRSITLVL